MLPAMEASIGVAFALLDESGTQVDFVDPYEYPAEVADQCAGITSDGKSAPADEVGEGDLLPATATLLFNFIFAGVVLFVFSSITLIVVRKRKKALE